MTFIMTSTDRDREERESVEHVKKEQKAQSTTTMIKVTETSNPKTGTESFTVRMTSILRH